MPLNVADVTKSPVLIALVAGGALVGGIYFYSKNQPGATVTGPTAPFSWDALSNWLQGWNGGPGGGNTGSCAGVVCPPGQNCVNGTCQGVTVPPGPNACTPTPCPSGQTWVQAECRCMSTAPSPPPNIPCQGASIGGGCPPGMTCGPQGFCVPIGGGGDMGQGLGRWLPGNDMQPDVSFNETLGIDDGMHVSDYYPPYAPQYANAYGVGGAGPQSAAYFGIGGGTGYSFNSYGHTSYGVGGGTGHVWQPPMQSTEADPVKQPRAVGYSPQIKALAQYQRLYALVAADQSEEGVYGGGYPGVY